jgi:uncharacterized protein YndB with AHSA1/START domain
MKIVGVVAALIVLGVVIVGVVGWRLPVAHRASRSVTLRASPESVFALIRTSSEFPTWRSDVTSVESSPPENGRERFREVGKNGSMLFEIDSLDPPRRMVTRIADKSLPFGGTWTYEVSPSADGTTLRITEDGEVYNPLFRFVSRFIMGHTAGMDRYLGDAQRRFAKAN